ncbi:hypothetical protein MU0083_002474 [[Mycobacterium] kokjensenii]|uniref:Uncharacterized protein n=1 Tax=[Mycobacterium] kokjensenii TaxID=3064287 RepID=A0ABN9NB35_9MYCO|nr:hypothetical protein [Mycolicibacter sp. MU0083]CAJ1500615.1 hypothetical protein MU0083_002474 [Mycolicibacter sp. MU0083]
MSQLVIKPWMPLPLPAGEYRDLVGEAIRHAGQRSRRLVLDTMALVERIGSFRIDPARCRPRLESAWSENARMAREMYRL